MIYKNQSTAEARLAYWKRILNLNDWEIEIAYASPSFIKTHFKIDLGEWDMATCSRQYHYKKAAIYIRDSAINEPLQPNVERDDERTLVHELVHLHLDEVSFGIKRDVWKSKHNRDVLERVVEMIARSIINAYRDQDYLDPCNQP